MTIEDITLGEQSKFSFGPMPIKACSDMHALSLKTICNYVKTVEGDWLNDATDRAKKEMISDYEVFIKEAKEQIKSIKQTIPRRHKAINVLKSLGIIIRLAWQRMLK